MKTANKNGKAGDGAAYIVMRLYSDGGDSFTTNVRVADTMQKARDSVIEDIRKTFKRHPDTAEALVMAFGTSLTEVVYDNDETRIEWGVRRSKVKYGVSSWVEL